MDPADAFNMLLARQNNGGPVAVAPGTGPAMSTGLSANQMSMYTPSNRHLLFSHR